MGDVFLRLGVVCSPTLDIEFLSSVCQALVDSSSLVSPVPHTLDTTHSLKLAS